MTVSWWIQYYCYGALMVALAAAYARFWFRLVRAELVDAEIRPAPLPTATARTTPRRAEGEE